MSRGKSGRIMNLALLLLTTRTYASRDRIREAVEGYRDLTDVSFERTFERDKDELRALGIPITVGTFDTAFGDVQGYRIERADFELPTVEFTRDEAMVLAIAAQVWQEESVSQPMTLALAKLAAAGVPLEAAHGVIQPSTMAREPSFAPLFEALARRRVVSFHYRGGAEERVVEPWSLPGRNGSWYLIGFDCTRGEQRCFKLGRITSAVTARGKDGAYEVPEDHDPEEALAQMRPSTDLDKVVVAVRDGYAPALTRRGRRLPHEALHDQLGAPAGASLPEGFGLFEVPVGRLNDAVGEICSHAPHVIALAPPHVREAVVAQLTHVAEAGA